jgi:hypothetical protein
LKTGKRLPLKTSYFAEMSDRAIIKDVDMTEEMAEVRCLRFCLFSGRQRFQGFLLFTGNVSNRSGRHRQEQRFARGCTCHQANL